MPEAQVGDVKIHYTDIGEGDPLLLIMGFGMPGDAWLGVLPFLDGFHAIYFDNRGTGQSEKPEGPYTIPQMADDAAGILDHLKIEPAHVYGVSMGGMIAQEYALAYGSDLRSATFGCTYAAPGPFCSRMFAMWGDMAPVLGVPFIMRDVTLWAFTVPFFEQRGGELAEFEQAMRYLDMPVHAYLAQLAVIQEHDTTARLGQVSTPTLVLAGEQDILIPVSMSRRLQEGIAGAEFATTPGGHACLWEHPAEFNQAFLAFIKRHGRG